MMFFIFILLSLAIWMIASFKLEDTFLVSLSIGALGLAILFLPIHFIIMLSFWPIAYLVNSDSITVMYWYRLRKKKFPFKYIQNIYYYRFTRSLYPECLLFIKSNGSYYRIEFVPNQVITYLYAYCNDIDIREIGDQQLKELKKYNTILTKKEKQKRNPESVSRIKDYKLFYGVLLSIGIVIAVIGGVLYQVFDYQRIGDLFSIFIGIHMIGITITVISGLKLLTKNRKLLSFEYH